MLLVGCSTVTISEIAVVKGIFRQSLDACLSRLQIAFIAITVFDNVHGSHLYLVPASNSFVQPQLYSRNTPQFTQD